jgi:hypothetical protein
VLILIMGGAQTQTFVLDLTTSAASKRHKGGIATYPLLTTWGVHPGHRGLTTEPAMLAGNRRGFHAIGGHRMAFLGGVGRVVCLALA